MLTSYLGREIGDLDTPSLCIDLDQFERNIATLSKAVSAAGKHWRPHAKCHKSPEIAQLLIQAGAIGITCAKTSEAEVFALAGIRDILIANMLVGRPKLERVAAMCRIADPIVACDHYVQAEALSQVCGQLGVRCRVVVEVNIGFQRVGVRPGSDTRDLTRGISTLPHVELVGVMGYEGHLLTILDPDEKRTKITSALNLLVEARDQMLQDGLRCDIVSAGGTGSYELANACSGLTEIQAGGGIFADPFYRDRCGVTALQPSLTLLATVVSRPKLERAVLDCGRKSLNPDLHPLLLVGKLLPAATTVTSSPQSPLVQALPDATIAWLSAEHTVLDLGPESQTLKIGDKVKIIPGYSDFTTVLHDRFHGIRQGIVEREWPITARGCIW